ncbi:MAG: hypothetical protein ABI461_10040, partial [Polyangiaceae bacterium]
MRRTLLRLCAVVSAVGVIGVVACGSSDDSNFENGNKSGDGGGGGLDDGSGGGLGGGEQDGASTKPIDSLAIDPATAALDVTIAPYPTKQFTATAHFHDGTTGPVPANWTASNAPVGSVDGSGLYKTSGNQGGPVTITAAAGGQTATATLTVSLHQISNPAGLDAATQASLLGATAADGSVIWTYPYDQMAYPRGIDAPNMMWNGAAAGDVYGIHIVSGTYELQAFTAVAPSIAVAGTTPAGATKFAFDPAIWAAFANSTSGTATVTVTRKSGSAYTKLIQQTWHIANKSMSGSIYYWAINAGAVLRIKPGESAPVNFLGAPSVTGPVPPASTKSMFCPSCHTASADGSTLVMGTGAWGQGGQTDVWSTVYNLKTAAASFYGYETTSPASRFPLAAVSADGQVIVENWAAVRGGVSGTQDTPLDNRPPTVDGMMTTLTGTNLDTLVGSGHHTFFPAFSADNQYFAYVDSTDAKLYGLNWDATARKFSSSLHIADPPAGMKIAYPTISPDHRYIVYQVGPDYGSLAAGDTGDLYAVDITNPLHPISLTGINTSMSAAQATTRDQHRSYEPTFAPTPSGGYFWLVFHSRRTYGNALLGNAYNSEGSGTKQLWVAAIDVPATAASTTDPSHPPFWLPGQDITTL